MLSKPLTKFIQRFSKELQSTNKCSSVGTPKLLPGLIATFTSWPSGSFDRHTHSHTDMQMSMYLHNGSHTHTYIHTATNRECMAASLEVILTHLDF